MVTLELTYQDIILLDRALKVKSLNNHNIIDLCSDLKEDLENENNDIMLLRTKLNNFLLGDFYNGK